MRLSRRAGPVLAVLLLLGLLLPDRPALAAGPSGPQAYLSVGSTLVPLDVDSGRTRGAIPLGGHARRVVIAPDGATAWVLIEDPQAVRRVDLRTGTRGPLVPVPGSPYTLALDPAGKALWVSDWLDGIVTTIDTATSRAAAPLHLGPGYTSGIAFSADGRTAFVGAFCDGTVLAVDVATRTVRSTSHLHPQMFYSCTGDLTLSADGRTVWASDEHGASGVTPIDVATETALSPYGVRQDIETGRSVLTPDGTRLYTATESGLVLVQLPSGAISDVTPQPASGYAVLPGGRTLLVVRGGTPGVHPLDTATGTFRSPLAPTVPATDVTVAPGQAPVARVTATRSGPAVAFDARASRGTTSPITTYLWRFGDGTSRTTTTARTTHTYAPYVGSGYTARLTVTDASGTSQERVFDGRQLLRNGGPSATTSVYVPG